MNERMRIDLWSDFSCPWCYVGAARLEKAVQASPHADQIEIVPRAFELDPGAPKVPVAVTTYVAKRMGWSEADTLRQLDSMLPLTEAEGLPYKSDRVAANTFDAHRVLQLATTTGHGPRFLAELQLALFGGRMDTFDHAFLVATAEGVGVARERAEQVLASDEFADVVRGDQAEAQQLGVTGVPFTVVDARYGIPGAVPLDTFTQAIDEAWSARGSQ
ncbi:DsbA family oxidoreductase [Tenggerimyces flavus]|uniref:DsbA family protein n=1 Tax=Tenggerimyces flavus TaxID=1708749 RepID=A0ABV7Y2Z9_9ACTN|nr:DsbA family oxidoreductase [Tenggerimyces flavus]MBM7790596.1 putative DsbA family dithiol-disulfide isomerase [Tenggerimyces flavus]